MAPLTALVVTLGNPAAGVDGFGPAVADWLRRAADVPETVEIIDARTDLLAHLDRFEECDHVVLVDAVVGARRQGVVVVDEETFAGWDERSPGCHSVSPLVAVRLFRRLHPASRARITLVALCADEVRLDAGLSSDLVVAGAQAVRQVLEDRRCCLSDGRFRRPVR